MDEKQFVEQLEKLVSFKTITGDALENKRGLDYIESLINSKAIIKRLINNGKEMLIAMNKKTDTPDVGYLVHLDVVAGSNEQFKMKKERDTLIGRGVSDMKFSIPIGIAVLNKLIEDKSNLTFTFIVTTDEEIGGYDGTAWLVEQKLVLPKVLIVPDGGDNFIFVEKAKGVCQVMVESIGKTAHASRPWVGKNATEPMIRLIGKLLDQYGKNNHQENWKTTMNIGIIEGGNSVNQVCDKTIVKLDFRYPETTTPKQILTEIKELTKHIEGEFKISELSIALPTYTDSSLKVVKDFINALEEQPGIKVVIGKTYGAADARHFVKLKTPILMIKPIGGEIHSEEEWISLDSCMNYYKGIQNFIEKLIVNN